MVTSYNDNEPNIIIFVIFTLYWDTTGYIEKLLAKMIIYHQFMIHRDATIRI